MKRASDDGATAEAKRPRASAEAAGTRPSEVAAVRAVLAHAPALARPPPHTSWGLDRLILDNRWAEGALRKLLHAAGTELPDGPTRKPQPPAAGSGDCAQQAPIYSLPGGAGQGLAAAVGMAMGQAHLAATYAPADATAAGLFAHRVFVLCSSTALPGGVSSEACSLAGHLRLATLVAICVDDGEASVEDVARRFKAYGWSVARATLGAAHAGAEPLQAALEATRLAERPTLILTTSEGAVPGDTDAAACQAWAQQGSAASAAWAEMFARYRESHPEAHAEILRRFSSALPEGWNSGMPEYTVGERAQATRQYGAKVLASIVSAVPEMVGGSADLTGSNLTNQAQLKDFQHSRHKGRYFRYGVREHAMTGASAGLSLYGGFIPFCATFLNFVTYGWPALRLAAASRAQLIYAATHDSIELGEDGPTHQPVEVLAACRALPNLLTLRPADGVETIGAYEAAVQSRSRPSVVALCRSGAPHLAGASREGVMKGGYILSDFDPALVPLVVLAGSGTEVALCVEAKAALQSIGVGARVVSVPCWELFDEQDEKYRQSVLFEPSGDGAPLPAGVKPVRVYVEAASTLGFGKYADLYIGMTTFGASGPAKDVRKHFGFERHLVATKVMDALKERALVVSYRLGRFGLCRFGAKVIAAMAD